MVVPQARLRCAGLLVQLGRKGYKLRPLSSAPPQLTPAEKVLHGAQEYSQVILGVIAVLGATVAGATALANAKKDVEQLRVQVVHERELREEAVAHEREQVVHERELREEAVAHERGLREEAVAHEREHVLHERELREEAVAKVKAEALKEATQNLLQYGFSKEYEGLPARQPKADSKLQREE